MAFDFQFSFRSTFTSSLIARKLFWIYHGKSKNERMCTMMLVRMISAVCLYFGDIWTKLVPIGNTEARNDYYVTNDVTVRRNGWTETRIGCSWFVLFCYRIKISLYFSIKSHIFSRRHRISSLLRTTIHLLPTKWRLCRVMCYVRWNSIVTWHVKHGKCMCYVEKSIILHAMYRKYICI